MPTSSPLSRRSFLYIMGWWLALGGALAGDAIAKTATGSKRVSRGLLAARDSAIAIGRVYLTHHPAESSTLRTALGLPSGDLDALSTQQVRTERRRLQAMHRDDFIHQRVQELGGYLFSQTELQLAALLVYFP